jgi:hypothetical protein
MSIPFLHGARLGGSTTVLPPNEGGKFRDPCPADNLGSEIVMLAHFLPARKHLADYLVGFYRGYITEGIGAEPNLETEAESLPQRCQYLRKTLRIRGCNPSPNMRLTVIIVQLCEHRNVSISCRSGLGHAKSWKCVLHKSLLDRGRLCVANSCCCPCLASNSSSQRG